jgi:hypothetical protein
MIKKIGLQTCEDTKYGNYPFLINFTLDSVFLVQARKTEMQKLILISFILLIAINANCALPNVEAIVDSLDRTIDQKQQFERQKEKEIELLKQWLQESSTTQESLDLSSRLYDAYRKYQIDSAIVYAEKALAIAQNLEVSEKIYHTSFQLAILYSSTGMFREAEAIL